MAYTTPPTFVSGAVLTAAQQNILSDDITFLYAGLITAPPYHAAEAYRGAAQSIPDATRTIVTLPTGENEDTDGFHDLVTNPSRLTVPTTLVPTGYHGVAVVLGFVRWASNSTGFREIRIITNGVAAYAEDTRSAVANTMGQGVHQFKRCSGGDYFEIDAYQTSTGSLNITEAALAIQIFGIQPN